MDLNRDIIRKLRGLILFTAILLVCLWRYENVMAAFRFIFDVLFPFILGGSIAFVLNVPMNFFERHLFSPQRKENSKIMQKAARPVSLILVLISVIGVIILVMFVLIPQLADTFANIGKSIQAFIPRVQEWALEAFAGNPDVMVWINSLEFDWDKIVDAVWNFFRVGAGNIVDSTITAAKNIVSFISTFFIAFVFAVYILLQKEKLSVQVKKVLFAFVRKGRAEAVLEVCSLTYNTFSNFLTGQCVEAIILGSMFVVAMALFRLPYALLVGVLIAFIGCGFGVFLIFIVDPFKALVFLILFLVLQQIEGNFIYPHVVGNSVGLPSIWVLAAVSLGGNLMGLVGMLIFIPLISVVYALFREIVYLKLKQRKINPEEIV